MKKNVIAHAVRDPNIGGDVAVDLEAPKPRRGFWGRKAEQPKELPVPQLPKELKQEENEEDGAEKIKEILDETAPVKATPPAAPQSAEMIEVTTGEVKAAILDIAQKLIEIASIFPDDDAERQEREQYEKLKAKFG